MENKKMKFKNKEPLSRRQKLRADFIVASALLFVDVFFMFLFVHYQMYEDLFSFFILGIPFAIILFLFAIAIYDYVKNPSELDGWQYVIKIRDEDIWFLSNEIELDNSGNVKIVESIEDEFVYRKENDRIYYLPYEYIKKTFDNRKLAASELSQFIKEKKVNSL